MDNAPEIKNNFDVDDIRRLREWNSLRHIKMTHEEIIAEYDKALMDALPYINPEKLQKNGKTCPLEK